MQLHVEQLAWRPFDKLSAEAESEDILSKESDRTTLRQAQGERSSDSVRGVLRYEYLPEADASGRLSAMYIFGPSDYY